MALTAARPTRSYGDRPCSLLPPIPIKANVKIFPGALVVYSGGYCAPATTAQNLIAAGVAVGRDGYSQVYDNTGGANDGLAGGISVMRGTFGFRNSATDPVTQADCGKQVFIEDDQTISRTNAGGNTQSGAGILRCLPSDGLAYVEITGAASL